MERKAWRQGVPIRTVKPAYTSIIGPLQYQPHYGISVHHAAAWVIGRRGGLKIRRENVPKALRHWMQAWHSWYVLSYRKNDWGAWARMTRTLTQTSALHHRYLDGWLAYRHTILPE